MKKQAVSRFVFSCILGGMQGAELIKRYVADLPHLPGVYRMLDAGGEVLYVGKARDLKNRVSSYTSLRDKNTRIAQMITRTAAMEFITTRNESEALLLEANLIRRLEPRYNILLRDDKSFPYLFLSAHDYPQIRSHRGVKKEKGEYYGPFASAGDLRRTLQHLQRVLLLRPCSDSYFAARKRPCLQYQIKRCSAPCVALISQADYARTVGEARKLLRGQSRAVQEALLAEMQTASEAMEYEKAAGLRDRLRALNRIQQEQGLQMPQLGDADVAAVTLRGSLACVQVFLYRDGRNFGNMPYFLPVAAGQNEAELLAGFLPQFYQRHEAPPRVLLSHEPEEADWLAEALNTKLVVPKRGEKLEAVTQALANAEQALKRRLDEELRESALLEGVAKLFGLARVPQRIEVFDNSHISGAHAIGAMIAAGPEGLMKKEYRKFTIKQAAGDDDYAMMREVLRRRLQRLEWREASDGLPMQGSRHSPLVTPDLLLIDGGQGQLSVAQAVLAELNLTIPLVAIAKEPERNAGRERFFVPGRPDFRLEPDDPVLHYLQRLRDEAHRFAIGTHRAKRSSALTKSQLDSIPGIGAKRKKALLHHFGSARAVANASAAELAQVEGIHAKTAERIWRHFHG